MKNGKPKYYWDSAVIISWLQDEKRENPTESQGLSHIINMMEKGNAILMTSVLWRVEVWDYYLNNEQNSLMRKVSQNKNFQELSANYQIMDLAGEIRSFHNQRDKTKRSIKTPDAIHLASALHYEATEFHTFDKKLISLDGNVGGHQLKINAPKLNLPLFNFAQVHDQLNEVQKEIISDREDEDD